MVQDIKRTAKSRGLTFQLPETFPAYSLHAARVAIVGREKPWMPQFVKSCFLAQFTQGKDIGNFEVLTQCLQKAEVDPEEIIEKSQSQETKDALRANTERAKKLSIFGAPSFIAKDNELFWGDDRLEQAIEWVKE